MKIEIDKKGLGYALMLAGIAGALFAEAGFIAKEIRRLSDAPSLPPETVVRIQEPADENSFYLEPPTASPRFLSKSEVVKKRDTLVWEKRDFIFADLDAMSVSLYAGGALQNSFPIVAKAEEGSFFAVPGGFYKIQGKAAEHIAKINTGRLAWAVYLYGNYLIHAVSAAPKTAGLAAGVAGRHPGGIQLSPGDAKGLFNFARQGMSVLVSGGAAPEDVAFQYFRKSVLPHSVPEVSAASIIAADLESGEILFEKNKNDAFPIASVTKFITALVAQERMAPAKLLVVGDEALRTYGNAAGLVRGEIFRADELLYGMILPSSNNAAKMFELAVPDFVAHMNEKAKEIGMPRTFFGDSSGLSRENISSAADLFTLLQYLDSANPDILAVSREKSRTVTSQNKLKTHVWTNINWPRGDARFLGGKAGFTDDSLQTMAGIYNVRAAEYGGRKIGIAALGSHDRIRDIRAVINYLEQNYVYGFAVSKGNSKLHPVASGAAVFEAVENLR